MSGNCVRLPVSIATALCAALVGAAPADCSSGAPAARWFAPLDVAPATINTSSGSVTYDCGNQSPITIVGASSSITLTGSCGEVDVNGAANTVNLATVAVVKANGTGNHIIWQGGPNGAAPQISNTGVGNTLVGPGVG